MARSKDFASSGALLGHLLVLGLGRGQVSAWNLHFSF